MKPSVAAFALALAYSTTAHAAVLNFNGGVTGSLLKYPTWVGSSLDQATEIDLHGNSWEGSNGLDPNDADVGGVSLSTTPIELTAIGLTAIPEVVSWNDDGDFFTATFDQITSIVRSPDRGGGAQLNVDFSGVVSDSEGLFTNDATTFDLSALDTFLGPNKVGELGFSVMSDGVPAFEVSPVAAAPTPEIGTLAMLTIGIAAMAGFGWKQRQARLAI